MKLASGRRGRRTITGGGLCGLLGATTARAAPAATTALAVIADGVDGAAGLLALGRDGHEPLAAFDLLLDRGEAELLAAQGRDLVGLAELSEAEFERWQRARQDRRRTELPPPGFLELEGFASGDAKRLEVLLARHVGKPVDAVALERDIAIVAGLDRYQTVTWALRRDDGRGVGLRVRGRVKPYAPPFMMLGLNLENTTSSDFRITTTARLR